MSDTKIKTSNIGNLAVTHALLHTDMDLTSKTVQVATPTSNTHPATKLYVDTEVANLIDSAPGTLDTLNELAAAVNDDANFNATIASSIATKLPLAGGTMTGNLQIYKAEPIITLQRSNNALLPGISWQGSGGAEAASIKLDGTSGATNTLIMSTYNGSTMAERLRLMTNAAGGIAVTGTISVTGTVDGVDIAARDAILTSTTTTAGAALPKAGGTMTGDVSLGDNVKAKFGASDDLQIYHASAGGGHSYIKEIGTGNLRIQGADITLQDPDGNGFISMIDSGAGGTVYLKHSGSNVLATTSTGIDVTGSVTATAFSGDGSALSGVGFTGFPTNATDLASPSEGDAYYNTTDNVVKFYTGSSWIPLTGTINRYDYTATANQTTFADIVDGPDVKFITEGGGGAAGDPLALVDKYFGPRIVEMLPSGASSEEIAIFTERVLTKVRDASGLRPSDPKFDRMTARFVEDFARGGLAKILEV